ncbi:methyltransferase domain-containing protein [Roseobacter sp. YSTF-M11]|uniref:Methyltransferase domain-containing protein n=1 Tax=Roseobacter insulae TaxID=2859783 RepID=A0A9X1JZ20_9RHOB|nr:methyltransferase domain-containing protein [Roseobacter insulae]MBW4708871.1 methyltransferase domain-containing protein [Roseobacter insulae]
MTSSNADQAEFWTRDAGHKWVEQQEMLDAFMQPVLSGLLARADLQPGERVLDIGCGTGASSLQAADAVGASGFVLGADISPTMLAQAHKRAAGIAQLTFALADAAEHPFDTATFDHMISRFGVMFFSDPVAAFSNIASSLKPGARVTFASWGQIPNNPWFTIAAQAAKAQLGAPPAVDPDEPGPFAFRDVDRVLAILTEAGFAAIDADVVALHLTPPGPPSQVSQMATRVGPAARTVAHFEASDEDARAIAARVQDAFRSFETPQGVRIPAEINFFQARAKAG